jgi:hypothetical protein
MWLLFIMQLTCVEPIDVVIPVARKDAKWISYCIAGVRRNCQGVRDIFILSEEPFTDLEEWVDEQVFPFTKEEVAAYLNSSPKNPRVGWYFQQLLKLYAAFVIPGISSNVLVVDADTLFIRPVNFFNQKGEALYNPGTEYHAFYFEHAAKLLPHFEKVFPEYSGISHHMLFQRPILEELFDKVEQHSGCAFWQAFCQSVDPVHLHASGASEYELYFNFVFSEPHKVQLRFLHWANQPPIDSDAKARKLIQQALNEGLDYISCHKYK